MEKNYDRDNIFFKAMTIVYQLMVLNVLFLVFSMPIFTIGASSKAMFSCIDLIFKNNYNNEFKTFLAYFKEDFFKSTKTFLILFVLYALVIFNFINAFKIGNIGWVLTVIQAPILIQIIVIHMHIFILQSKFDLTMMKSFKVSWIMGNRNIIRAIGSLFILYILIKMGMRIPAILIFSYFSIGFSVVYFFFIKSVNELVEISK